MAARSSSKSGVHNNYVLIVFDSCRYDSFLSARPRTMRKLGKVERRWSYASWTAPSHYNLLMGLMPHTSPRNVYASEYYKKDFFKFNERLGAGGIEFKSLRAAPVSAGPAAESGLSARTPWFRCRC